MGCQDLIVLWIEIVSFCYLFGVWVSWDYPADPPGFVTVTGGMNSVTITWSPPVYRGSGRGGPDHYRIQLEYDTYTKHAYDEAHHAAVQARETLIWQFYLSEEAAAVASQAHPRPNWHPAERTVFVPYEPDRQQYEYTYHNLLNQVRYHVTLIQVLGVKLWDPRGELPRQVIWTYSVHPMRTIDPLVAGDHGTNKREETPYTNTVMTVH